jgi:hypothetical protein
MPRTSNLQRAGWVITLIGVSSFAVASPLSAWLTRHSYTAFSFSVGWANVLSTVLTALGLIMSIGDKLGALSVKDNENLASIADGLTRHALRQDSALLAQLLVLQQHLVIFKALPPVVAVAGALLVLSAPS